MIIFFYGDDNFRSKKSLRELKEKFVKEVDPQSNSLILIDGQKIDLSGFSEKINHGSLFSQKRLLIIEDIFKNKKAGIFSEFLGILNNKKSDSGDTIVFYENDSVLKNGTLKKDAALFFKFLKEQKFSQEFKTLTGASLLSFIKKELSSYNKEITQSAAKLLTDNFSDNNWLLGNELKKIAFSTNEKIISLDDVKKMIKESFSEDIFSLTDAIGEKNNQKAVEILEQQYLAGLSDEYLLSMLIRHFKILLQVKEEFLKDGSSASIANSLKLHPFVVKKSLAQGNKFSHTDIIKIFNHLINLDFKNKTGKSRLSEELFVFIATL